MLVHLLVMITCDKSALSYSCFVNDREVEHLPSGHAELGFKQSVTTTPRRLLEEQLQNASKTSQQNIKLNVGCLGMCAFEIAWGKAFNSGSTQGSRTLPRL